MTSLVTRRDFLAATAVASAAAGSLTHGLASLASAQDKTMPDSLPVIDTHQHLWDLTKFKLHFSINFKKNYFPCFWPKINSPSYLT